MELVASTVTFSFFLVLLAAPSDAGVTRYPCPSRPRSDCPPGQTWHWPSCACVPERKCPLLVCPERLNTAQCTVYKQDASGCPTCQCECTELSQICPVNCPGETEIITSSAGCRECRCKPDICSQTKCSNICLHGRLEDRNGCPTCTCKPRRRPICPPVMCKENCPYGTFDDTNDCPTCVCKPKPICPLLSCDNFCPNGRLQDSNGCDVCECKPIMAARCPPLCAMHCPNGYVLGKHGCPLCRCKAGNIGRATLVFQTR